MEGKPKGMSVRLEKMLAAHEVALKELDTMLGQRKELTKLIAKKRREIIELDEDMSREQEAISVRENFFDAVEGSMEEKDCG